MVMSRSKVHQIDAFNDRYLALPEKMRRYVDRSWAFEFYEHVTSKINEDRFTVLFSDEPASRPSTPADQPVSALIIKGMRQVTDQELLDNIMVNIIYQAALGLTGEMNSQFSDRTLGRFRERLEDCEKDTGINLVHEEMPELAEQYCGDLKIDKTKKRMDSVMIESRGKVMIRLEIIFTTVMCAVKITNKTDSTLIPEDMKHYLNPDDRNKVIYHDSDEQLETRLERTVKDAFVMEEIMRNAGSCRII